MARADVLLDLVRGGAKGDTVLFRKSLEALIVEERAKQHHILADRLAAHLQQNGGSSNGVSISTKNGKIPDLFFEITPQRRLGDLH